MFALATGGAQTDVPSHELVAINAAAADALSLAIVDAVVAAEAHPRGADVSAQAPRPAALREVAPDLVEKWEALTTAS